MNPWLYSPPGFLKLFFSEFKWNTSDNKILITFDDGPKAGNTEKLLKFLGENKIKSIFFCVGENIQKSPNLIKELISEGHTIGNHMPKHQIITKVKTPEIIENITVVNNLCFELFDYKLKYFRPPHGKFDLRTQKILKDLGMTNIMWSLITYDFRNDLNLVKSLTDRFLKSNSIIVYHDNIKSSEIIIDSLKYLLDKSASSGYSIGEPSGCLK